MDKDTFASSAPAPPTNLTLKQVSRGEVRRWLVLAGSEHVASIFSPGKGYAQWYAPNMPDRGGMATSEHDALSQICEHLGYPAPTPK